MPGALRGQWDEGAGLVRGPDFEGCQAVRTGPRGHGLMWAGMRAPKRWSNKELNARRPNIPRISVIWWALQGICREETTPLRQACQNGLSKPGYHSILSPTSLVCIQVER